jgi:hypothetical protein
MLYVSNFNNRTNLICTTHQRTDTYPLFSAGLDPPLLLYFPRLVIRTFLRLFRLRPPCAPGCEERIGEVFFSKDSIIWWCLSNHWINRKRNQDMMQRIGLGTGREVERRRMRRIGGWGSELKRWLSDVQKMVDLRKAKCD